MIISAVHFLSGVRPDFYNYIKIRNFDLLWPPPSSNLFGEAGARDWPWLVVWWRQSDVCHNYLIWPPYLCILDQIIMATLIFTKLYRFQCLWWYRAPYNFCFRFSGQFGNREEALKFYRLLHCLFVKIKSQLYFSLFMPAFIVPVWILLSVNHILL